MNMITRRKEMNTIPTRKEHEDKIDEIRRDIKKIISKIREHAKNLKWCGVQNKFLMDIKEDINVTTDYEIAWIDKGVRGRAIKRVEQNEWKEEEE